MKWLPLWVYILNKYTCIWRVCLFFLQKGFLSLDVRLCRKQRERKEVEGSQRQSGLSCQKMLLACHPLSKTWVYFTVSLPEQRGMSQGTLDSDGPVQDQASSLLYLSLRMYCTTSLCVQSRTSRLNTEESLRLLVQPVTKLFSCSETSSSSWKPGRVLIKPGIMREISGAHGGEHEDGCLLGGCAV
jgi:hypothetical protein